jgi:DNA-binding NtrC family response regulator
MLHPVQPILIVDDEVSALESFATILQMGGFTNLITCADSRQVQPLLARQPVSCLLLDLQMPYLPGRELLDRLREGFPEIPVIVITGLGDIETAVDCIKKGACDFLVKPVEKNQLLALLKRTIEFQDLKRSYANLRENFFSGTIKDPRAFSTMVTAHPLMGKIFLYLQAVAPSPEPVLVGGETGVGKELAARILHQLSGRPGKFVAVNAAGVDDQMFADTLFGHEKGAFTDARDSRPGLIREAEGGTLFLDEIGELSGSSQVKLLRLLQEYEYYSLGSDVARSADVRMVVASNHDLPAMLSTGKLRKDLFHRLSVHHLCLPPLRERLSDIPLLLDHFFAMAADKLKKKKPTLPAQLAPLLQSYHFPGNVRELRAMVFDAMATHPGGIMSLGTFKNAMGRSGNSDSIKTAAEDSGIINGVIFNRLPTLKQAEETLINQAMEQCNGNQALAARLLGISRQALNGRLNKTKQLKTKIT